MDAFLLFHRFGVNYRDSMSKFIPLQPSGIIASPLTLMAVDVQAVDQAAALLPEWGHRMGSSSRPGEAVRSRDVGSPSSWKRNALL